MVQQSEEVTKTGYILFERDTERQSACITFNRPEKLNALTLEMYREMQPLIEQVNDDDEIKSLVFRGAGSCFSSGHDVAEAYDMYYLQGQSKVRRPPQRTRVRVLGDQIFGRRGIMQAILHCRKATIAQVHGYCYGNGFEFTSMCDIAIASEDARFGHPAFKLLGPAGDLSLLIETVGLKRAKWMLLTGHYVTAAEAERMGFVSKVVPREELEAEVQRTVELIQPLPLDGLVVAKGHFEAVLDARGVGAGLAMSYLATGLQSNQRLEPGEYNLQKAKAEGGVTGSIRARDRHFRDSFSD